MFEVEQKGLNDQHDRNESRHFKVQNQDKIMLYEIAAERPTITLPMKDAYQK